VDMQKQRGQPPPAIRSVRVLEPVQRASSGLGWDPSGGPEGHPSRELTGYR